MTILSKIRLINNRFLLKNFLNLNQKQSANYLSLAEVGILEEPKLSYEPGQLFLHRIFGYRGAILINWEAKVYDKSLPTKRATKVKDEYGIEFDHISKEVKGHSQTYYQVLMDIRDTPFIRNQTESVTFLSSGKNSRQLCSISHLDYVSHSDIIPYINTDVKPIENELMDKFLIADPNDKSKFIPNDTLLSWKEKNHSWLKLSYVYKETTNNIRVTVLPFFIGVRYSQNTTNYWWRYMIRIENLGQESVKIRERNWTIYSLSGCLESMVGTGIGGSQPVLSVHQPAFQYSSHVNIQQSPSGHMAGYFKMEKENGEIFNCIIPSFPLISKTSNQS